MILYFLSGFFLLGIILCVFSSIDTEHIFFFSTVYLGVFFSLHVRIEPFTVVSFPLASKLFIAEMLLLLPLLAFRFILAMLVFFFEAESFHTPAFESMSPLPCLLSYHQLSDSLDNSMDVLLCARKRNAHTHKNGERRMWKKAVKP